MSFQDDYRAERAQMDRDDRFERERALERVAEMTPAPDVIGALGGRDPLAPRRVEINAALAEALDKIEEGEYRDAARLVETAIRFVTECEPAVSSAPITLEDFEPACWRRDAVRAVLRRHEAELGGTGDWDYSTALLDELVAAADQGV